MRDADRDWMGRALCADMDTATFFPIAKVATRKAYLAEVNAAQKVCRMCPVVADCAGYALRNGIRWGIWGGIDMEHLPRRDRLHLGAFT